MHARARMRSTVHSERRSRLRRVAWTWCGQGSGCPRPPRLLPGWVGAGGPSDFLLEGEAVELLAPAGPASWTGAGRAKAGGPVAAGGASAAGPWHWRVPGGALAGADLAGRVAPKDR